MKKTAVLFVGYHYLSTPVYQALKAQLPDYTLLYVFTKDIIGADTNFEEFDRETLKRTDPNFVELAYDPPWFKSWKPWHLRTKPEKLLQWIRSIGGYRRFKSELSRLMSDLKPALFITTSDLAFTPRFLAAAMPWVPIVTVQPSYLDLWERARTYPLLKAIVNAFEPMVFERQEYFGMEIERAALLVWEVAAYEAYVARGRRAIKVVSPTHLALRDAAARLRTAERGAVQNSFGLNDARRLVSFFPAYYADVRRQGHGPEYQANLEESYREVIRRLDDRDSIVIKVHPNESLDYWRRVFSDVASKVTLVQQCERFHLMAVSDFVISTNSYAAVEASLCGAVAVNFVPGVALIGEDFCHPFNRNAALSFSSADELARCVRETRDAQRQMSARVASVQDAILGYDENRPTVQDVVRELVPGRATRVPGAPLSSHTSRVVHSEP